MSVIRKFFRLTLFLLWLVVGALLTIIFLRNTRPPKGIATSIIGFWLGFLTRVFGVNIKTYGTALSEKTLFVANHISWLDILILGKLVPIHFLAKQEIKTMPVLGWLATRAGTLYIKRGNKTSASKACSEITKALTQQHNSLVFAEGTTSDGNVKKFHSKTLQSAIDAEAMIQPVAIFYPAFNSDSGKVELDPVTLFVGDTTMGESFNRIIQSEKIDVEVHFLPAIHSQHKKRDEIATYAYNEVVKTIEKIQSKSRKLCYARQQKTGS